MATLITDPTTSKNLAFIILAVQKQLYYPSDIKQQISSTTNRLFELNQQYKAIADKNKITNRQPGQDYNYIQSDQISTNPTEVGYLNKLLENLTFNNIDQNIYYHKIIDKNINKFKVADISNLTYNSFLFDNLLSVDKDISETLSAMGIYNPMTPASHTATTTYNGLDDNLFTSLTKAQVRAFIYKSCDKQIEDEKATIEANTKNLLEALSKKLEYIEQIKDSTDAEDAADDIAGGGKNKHKKYLEYKKKYLTLKNNL